MADNTAAATPIAPSTPASGKKRGRQARAPSTPGSGVNDSADDTPSKKRAVRETIPKNESELSEADKLTMRMKKDGKKMSDIAAAVASLTGKEVQVRSLAKRCQRLMAAFTEWEDREVHALFAAKKEVENDIATTIKKLEGEKYSKIAEVMEQKYSTKKFTGIAIEKKFKQTEKTDFVPGPVPGLPGAAGGSSATPAQAKQDDEEIDNDADEDMAEDDTTEA